MIKYLKLLEFFKEFLNGRDEWPSPVLVGLYVSDNYMSLAVAGDSYLKAHYYGLYPIGSLDDLVEQLQSLQSVDHKLRRIIVSSNNSVELDLDDKGIIGSNNNSVAPPVNIPVNIRTLIDKLCKKGNFESLKYTYLKDNLKSWRADLSGITFPIRHPRPQCRRPGNFEVPSAVRMLQRADLSGITFPIRHRLPRDPQLGNIEVSSVVHMLKVGLDFLNTLVDRKNVEGKKDSE